MKFLIPERISLKGHPEFTEKWVQDRITDNPAILGLGDLEVFQKERPQPKAGRLDILLQDSEQGIRYEVEIQLGSTDESHIIRTIEYWDLERKRNKSWEHRAVIVAEDITHRFQNVISLFNGSIPVIAIQMAAHTYQDNVMLTFTKILDVMNTDADEDEAPPQDVDRSYWETIKGTPATVKMADDILNILKKFDGSLSLKYNKFYIGLARNNQPDNFVLFRPKKTKLNVEIKLERSDSIQNELEESGLDLLEYNTRYGRYKIKLSSTDIQKYDQLLTKYLKLAYQKGQATEEVLN